MRQAYKPLCLRPICLRGGASVQQGLSAAFESAFHDWLRGAADKRHSVGFASHYTTSQMNHASDAWTCDKCTAINPGASRSCWNCKTARVASPELKSSYATAETDNSLRDLLLGYIGEMVDVNFQDPTKATAAVLAAVHSDYFTLVQVAHPKKYHYPLHQVVSAAEVPSTETPTGKTTLVIEVHRQVFPKGAIGVGFSFPV